MHCHRCANPHAAISAMCPCCSFVSGSHNVVAAVPLALHQTLDRSEEAAVSIGCLCWLTAIQPGACCLHRPQRAGSQHVFAALTPSYIHLQVVSVNVTGIREAPAISSASLLISTSHRPGTFQPQVRLLQSFVDRKGFDKRACSPVLNVAASLLIRTSHRSGTIQPQVIP